MVVRKLLLNLLQQEIARQSQTAGEHDELRVEDTAQVHAAHAQRLGRNVDAVVGNDVSSLGRVHDRLGCHLRDVAQRGGLRRMILQVLLRLQHQAVRRRVLLVAALLAAAAGRSVHNVDLLVRNVKKANGVARLASRCLRG